MRTIVAGNWKMNTDRDSAAALLAAMVEASDAFPRHVDAIVAPPFPFLEMAVRLCAGTRIAVAAQNCHQADKGAFTGEVSAAMLRSLGVQACIVGHSERRQYFGESDALIAEKVRALLAAGITPILCCGERREERESGRHFDVVTEQLKGALDGIDEALTARLIIAYEPVWAIGTGLTATKEQAQEMHARIRALLRTHAPTAAEALPLLYGGSCNPANAEGIFGQPDVNGGLIGGASLDAGQFTELVGIAGRCKP
ncbi:MAG: triose-phosphate isomerase [Flavobacteriales bacterium]|jgi:triosephosphate isomerase|nr:MAG: triose-phosphate isomerase [Flavobacteriales bacterium]